MILRWSLQVAVTIGSPPMLFDLDTGATRASTVIGKGKHKPVRRKLDDIDAEAGNPLSDQSAMFPLHGRPRDEYSFREPEPARTR